VSFQHDTSRCLAAFVAAAVISLGATASADNGPTGTAASKCVSRAGLPDLHCTPGALNPNVKQKTIKKTICVANWTDTVRPPTSYTDKLKVRGIADYGYKDKTLGHYEEDHLIPLAVGGSPRSPKNLWPEPYRGKFGARVKDKLERFLHDRVCDGTVRLSKARKAFRDWKAAFKRFRPLSRHR
jgi:hypothetical protein